MKNLKKSMFTNEKQRWSLRKVSVGLASVMLGLTFMTTSQSVKADTVSNSEVATEQTSQQNESSDVNKQTTSTEQNSENPTDATKQEKQQSKLDKVQNVTSNVKDKADKINKDIDDTQKVADQVEKQGVSDIKDVDKDIRDRLGNIDPDKANKPIVSENQVKGDKNDQEKANQLHKVTREQINQQIFNKYNDLINNATADDSTWSDGLPTDEEQDNAETKHGTTIKVHEAKDGVYPLENNYINNGDHTWTYTAKNGRSSVFGFTGGFTIQDRNEARNFSVGNFGYSDDSYRWRKLSNNLIIDHSMDYSGNFNNNGASYDIVKDEDGITVDKYTDDKNSNEVYDAYVALKIHEYIVVTPEGNIIHEVNFKNVSDDEHNASLNHAYYTLIDTCVDSADGIPIYSTGKDGLFITNGKVVYGIRGLGTSKLYATDYSKASKWEEPYQDNDVAVNNVKANDAVLSPSVKDTAIRVISPEMTLDEGDTATLWYMETAYSPKNIEELEKMGPVAIGNDMDARMDQVVSDWIKKVEDANKNTQNIKDTTDQVLNPIDKGITTITKPVNDLKDKVEEETKPTKDVLDVVNDNVKVTEDTAGISDGNTGLIDYFKKFATAKWNPISKIVTAFKTAGNVTDVLNSVHTGISSIKKIVEDFAKNIGGGLKDITKTLQALRGAIRTNGGMRKFLVVFALNSIDLENIPNAEKLLAKSVISGKLKNKKQLKGTLTGNKMSKALAQDATNAVNSQIDNAVNRIKTGFKKQISTQMIVVKNGLEEESKKLKTKVHDWLSNLGGSVLVSIISSALGAAGSVASMLTSGLSSFAADKLADGITSLLWDGKLVIGNLPTLKVPNFTGINGMMVQEAEKSADLFSSMTEKEVNSVVDDMSSTLKKEAKSGISDMSKELRKELSK